jgi:hypothetical protein
MYNLPWRLYNQHTAKAFAFLFCTDPVTCTNRITARSFALSDTCHLSVRLKGIDVRQGWPSGVVGDLKRSACSHGDTPGVCLENYMIFVIIVMRSTSAVR